MGWSRWAWGLIPAGGGCKEMLLRSHDLKKVFELIGFAKVSTSAVEARLFHYLRDGDGISMNPERLIDDAKRSRCRWSPYMRRVRLAPISRYPATRVSR
jgi:3-hydroxyacyl-CoA dehydrogenase